MNVIIACLRTRISFEILRSVHVSIMGSRSPFYRKEFEAVDDFGLNVKAAGVSFLKTLCEVYWERQSA